MKKTLILSTMLLACFAAALAAPTVAAPEPTHSADDVISIYSDTYGNVSGFNVNPNWGQNTETAELAIDDNNYISMVGLTYQGHEFDNTDVSNMEFLHVDIFPTTQDNVKLVPIWKNVDANTNYTEIVYTISGLTLNEWNSIDIDLANYASDDRGGTNIVYQFKWDGGNSNTFYADNIYFFKSSTDDTEAPKLVSATASKVQGTWATITANATDNVTGNLTYSIYNDEELLATATGLAGKDTDVKVENLTVSTAYELTVKVADKAGNEAADSKTVTFTTLDADEAINYYGTVEGTNAQGDFVISYTVTYNANKTLTVTAEIETPELAGLNHQMSFVSGLVEEWVDMIQDGDVWTYTTTETVEEGTSVEFFFWLSYTGGVFGGDYHITYVAGSENEKPASLRISAEAQNVTTESAEITYTLSGETEGAAVYYKTSDATDWTEATANPIALTGLTENTEYSYVLKAVNGELTSSEATVAFKTISADAVDLVYADYVKAVFTSAYLNGESESDRRTFYYSLPFSVTLRADGTARYEIDVTQCADIVGLSPQIYCGGSNTLKHDEGSNIYYWEFGSKTYGETVSISHFLAYNSGKVDINFGGDYGTWGLTKERPELGEATTLSLSVPIGKRFVQMGNSIYLNLYATDTNGYYVSTDNVELDVNESKATLSGTKINVNCLLEQVTVTATLGSLSDTAIIDAIADSNAQNTPGTIYLDGSTTAYTDGFLTDGSYTTLYDFGTESANHSICFDLGEAKTISSVYLGWEGAYPSAYTVTFTNTNPIGSSIASPKRKATAGTDITRDNIDPVYSTDNGVNVAEAVYYPNTENTYRYVNIVTTEAATDYGIKLSEAKVYTGVALTGIEDVNVEDDATAPVEYYNLNGIRVLNPEHGIYIRRQGNKAQKVVL